MRGEATTATSLAWMAVASLAVSTILIPDYLLLYHSSNTITIDKGNNSNNFPLRLHLRALFVIVLTQMHRYYNKSFFLRVYFDNDVQCDKKAVTVACMMVKLAKFND